MVWDGYLNKFVLASGLFTYFLIMRFSLISKKPYELNITQMPGNTLRAIIVFIVVIMVSENKGTSGYVENSMVCAALLLLASPFKIPSRTEPKAKEAESFIRYLILWCTSKFENFLQMACAIGLIYLVSFIPLIGGIEDDVAGIFDFIFKRYDLPPISEPVGHKIYPPLYLIFSVVFLFKIRKLLGYSWVYAIVGFGASCFAFYLFYNLTFMVSIPGGSWNAPVSGFLASIAFSFWISYMMATEDVMAEEQLGPKQRPT